MKDQAAFGGQAYAATTFPFEPYNAINVPAGRPPVALHKPLSRNEICHVTKMFDTLFNQYKPALPTDLVVELDAFEYEFANKYHAPMGIAC